MHRDRGSCGGRGYAARPLPRRAARIARPRADADRRQPGAGRRGSSGRSDTWSKRESWLASITPAQPAIECRSPTLRSRSLTRTRICSSSTSRRAWSCIPPGATGRARWPRRCSAGAAAGDSHGGRNRPPARPRHLRPARRREERGRASGAKARSRRARSDASTWRSSGRPPARAGTIDAPIGRDRRNRTLMSIDSDEHAPRGPTSRLNGCFPTRRSCGSCSRPAARTRFACISPRSDTRIGDLQYGGAEPLRPRAPVPARGRLGFDHPVEADPVDVASPLPADLRRAMIQAVDDD